MLKSKLGPAVYWSKKTGKPVRLRKRYCLLPVTPPKDGRYNIQVTRRAQECDDEGACVTKLSVFGRADGSVAKAFSVLSISTGLANINVFGPPTQQGRPQ